MRQNILMMAVLTSLMFLRCGETQPVDAETPSAGNSPSQQTETSKDTVSSDTSNNQSISNQTAETGASPAASSETTNGSSSQSNSTQQSETQPNTTSSNNSSSAGNQTPETQQPETPKSTITLKIAAFNADVLGKTKMSKQAVVNYLAEIIVRYDIILIQEVRDVSEETPTDLLNAVNKKNKGTYNLTAS